MFLELAIDEPSDLSGSAGGQPSIRLQYSFERWLLASHPKRMGFMKLVSVDEIRLKRYYAE